MRFDRRSAVRVAHAPGGKSNTAGLFGGDAASRATQQAQQAQARRHQATLDANYQHQTPAVDAMQGMTAGAPSQQGNWGTSVGGGVNKPVKRKPQPVAGVCHFRQPMFFLFSRVC